MSKMKEVMNVLGIKEGVPYDVIDIENEHTVVSSPYMYDGDTFVDYDNDTLGNDGILWSLIKGEYTVKPVIVYSIPKDTPKDTKVYVRDSEDKPWRPAYLAKLDDNEGTPMYGVYAYGRTSFTAELLSNIKLYKYCKLA